MKEENAINFLMYSYFGITLDSESEEIKKAAVFRAYQDASSHVLSVSGTKTTKENLKNDGLDKIKIFIDSVCLEKADYEEQHRKCCDELLGIYKGKTDERYPFTYGIAQKWINMTMKYLYIILSILGKYKENHEFYRDYFEKLIRIESEMDVPLDSFLLEYISNSSKKKKYQEHREQGAMDIQILQKNGQKGYYSDKVLAWSKYENYEPYRELQSTLKKKLEDCEEKNPLDWEGPVWIKVSRWRKK